MKEKLYTQINVTPKTKDCINYTAMILGKTTSQFLDELFSVIIQEAGKLKNANLDYKTPKDGHIELIFDGVPMLSVVGRCSEQELTEMLRKVAEDN